MSAIAWIVWRITKRDARVFNRARRIIDGLRGVASGPPDAGRFVARELLSRGAARKVHARRSAARMDLLALGSALLDPLPRCRECRASHASARHIWDMSRRRLE